MTGTVVLPQPIADDITRRASEPDETAGVLICSVAESETHGLRLLGREMHWLTPSAYDRKSPVGLLLNAEGYTRPLSRAESLKGTPLWVHTHPGHDAVPMPSAQDQIVDLQIADVFRVRSG